MKINLSLTIYYLFQRKYFFFWVNLKQNSQRKFRNTKIQRKNSTILNEELKYSTEKKNTQHSNISNSLKIAFYEATRQ